MSWPDVVNGLFEGGGGIIIWLNVLRLSRDRLIRGVDWRVSAFFQLWGVWNLFYYPHLGQWASLAGCVLITAANTAWLALALRYREN